MLNCLFSLINKYTPHSYSNHTLSFGVDLTISLNSRTSGEPYFSYTIAFMVSSKVTLIARDWEISSKVALSMM